MTREEAKKVFEYLEERANTQEPCDDAISRKKAICVISACDGKSAQIEALEQLPSVTQKSGKWHRKYDRIVNDYFWECDKCGCGYQHEYNYCPNCGAKMVEPQESEVGDDNNKNV